MIHYMNLRPRPFSMIAGGQKTIELRLYDEKRKSITPGNIIVFTNTDAPEQTLSVKVQRLHIFPSFMELYQSLPLEQCGYLPEELADADPRDMEAYYTPDQQAQYGVVGIEIQLL